MIINQSINQSITRKREDHIDGLKGLLCLAIMLGHFFMLWRTSKSEMIQSTGFYSILHQKPFNRLFHESYWVLAFFVLSGFLLSFSRVKSILDLGKKSVKRFFRLYLPIVAACIIIYIIYLAVGFKNSDAGLMFESDMWGGYYSRKLVWYDVFLDPLKTIFAGGSKFNGPYWVISRMFYGSLLVYLFNYIKGKLGDSWYIRALIGVAAVVIFRFIGDNILFGMFVGMTAGYFKDDIKKVANRKIKCLLGIVMMLAVVLPIGIQNHVLNLINDNLFMTPAFLRTDNNWYIFYFAVFVLLCTVFETPKKIFSANPILFLGKINFGVYSLHWPVICSFGAMMLVCPIIEGHMLRNFLLSFLICVVITIVLSAVYHYTLEKWSFRLIDIMFKKRNKAEL